MPARLRKAVLTAHVVATVGWLGAVVVFLALGVVGLVSEDPATVRGAYLSMEMTAWLTLVPLAIASLLTGTIQGLGTRWGLVQHYWVLFKLLITVVATAVLLLYTQTFVALADTAADPTTSLERVRSPSPVLHAAIALVLLLAATVLAVYKPPGLTPWGHRRRRASATGRRAGREA